MLTSCHLDYSSSVCGEYGQVTAIHCGWTDTSLFGLCAGCAFSTGHKREADIKRPHRTGPLLPLFHQIQTGKSIPLVLIYLFLCSRVLQGTESNSNYKYHWAKFLVTDLRVFCLFPPCFSALKLKMMAHLDNASFLQWTPSCPALDGTSCNHILWFFLFCKLLYVKALFKWIQISAYYCKHLHLLWVWLYSCFYKWRAIKSSHWQSRTTRP